jgi:chemotaxis protein methyltransferase CheR
LESGEQHYRLAGGQGRFRDYFDPTACGGKLRAFLRASSSFSTHNLVSDGAFIEAQCVLCRNVLIYFSPSLRQKVLKLLKQSLCPDGYLWLGHQETVSDPALTLIAEPSLYRLPCPTF